ncbi:flagellar cap protein, partial [Shigella sonnei]|nr:flagellar cap protein [Shigella sonnei]
MNQLLNFAHKLPITRLSTVFNQKELGMASFTSLGVG